MIGIRLICKGNGVLRVGESMLMVGSILLTHCAVSGIQWSTASGVPGVKNFPVRGHSPRKYAQASVLVID